MIEPVELENFFIAFLSGAMVVMAGALYALLFAWSRVHGVPRLMPLAYAAYGVLTVSTLTFGHVCNLEGLWQGVVVAILAGYLLAPHGIWHLCVGTHAHGEAADEGGRASRDY